MSDCFHLLENYPLFSKLIDNRYKRNNIDIFDLELIESFIISNYKNKRYIDIIKKYTSFIYEKFKENPYIIFDSRIIRYPALNHFFDRNQLLEITKFRKRTHLEYLSIINNIKKGQTISEKYLRYVISLIGLNDEVTEKTYKFLVNNYNKNHSYFADEFIIKYTAYLSGKELGIPYDNVYYTDFDFVRSKVLDSSGLYNIVSKYIFINTDRDNKGLIGLIETVAHEMKHRKQHLDYLNDQIGSQYMNWLLGRLFDEYIKENPLNYFHSESELDANNYGWDLTTRIIAMYFNSKRHLKETLSNKNEYLFSEAINCKVGKDVFDLIESDNYNVKKLDEIMSKHPEIMKKCDFLENIYDINGKRHDFRTLIYNEYLLSLRDSKKYRKVKEAFKMFYLSNISNGIDIEIEYFDEGFQRIIINKLLDLVIGEIEDILNIRTLLKLNGSGYNGNADKKIKVKTKRIKTILRRLNRSIPLISKFNDKLINSKIEKLSVLIGRIKFDIGVNLIGELFYLKNTREIRQSGYKLQRAIK